MKFGWIPDLPDHRDRYHTTNLRKALPVAVDMRPQSPPVYDQGSLGSCTAQSIAGALHFTQLESRKVTQVDTPSRLFIYYNTRVLQGTVNEDSGATLRNTIKAVVNDGFGPEINWPYKVSAFKTKPPKSVYTNASERKLTNPCYERVENTNLLSIKSALAENNPIIFGFTVYDSFLSDKVKKNGVVPMPKRSESTNGGHAMLIVGYNDLTRRFTVRNSWGKSWGHDGYCYMPYEFLTNDDLANDFWVIKNVP